MQGEYIVRRAWKWPVEQRSYPLVIQVTPEGNVVPGGLVIERVAVVGDALCGKDRTGPSGHHIHTTGSASAGELNA